MLKGRYSSDDIFIHGVRSEVLISFVLEEWWRSDYDPDVLWRYFGSEQGVFRIFPGVELPKLYEPSQRPWYEMARSLLFEYYSQQISWVSCGKCCLDVLSALSATMMH